MNESLHTSCGHTDFCSNKRRACLGFTLIEVLISIFIFSIMGVTMFIVFNSTVGQVGTLDQNIADYEMGRTCMDRMVADMESLFVHHPPLFTPPEFGESPGPYRIVADAQDIDGMTFSLFRFPSFAHLPLEKIDRRDIAEIVYYVHRTPDNDLVLRRSDSLYPFPEFEEKATDPILCNRMRSLRLTFFDEEHEEYDEWNSETEDFSYATPSAIGIHLEFGEKAHPISFETMVKPEAIRKKYEKAGT